MSDLETLRHEVQRLSLELEALQTRRVRRSAMVFGLGSLCVLASLVAFAAPYDCNTGGLGRGLTCFRPNEPAVANDINGNFYTLSAALDAGEMNAGLQAARLSSLETRMTSLEGAKRIASGHANYPNPSCAGTGNPCRIDLPANFFGAAPQCTLTMQATDTSGYQEHMVIKDVFATYFLVWEGQYYNAGATMVFDWICVGR